MESNRNEQQEEYVNMFEEWEREDPSTSYALLQAAENNEDADWSDDDPEVILERELVEGVLKLAVGLPNIPYLKRFRNLQTCKTVIVCTPNLNDDVSLSQFESRLMKKNGSVNNDNGEPREKEPASINKITFVGVCHRARVYRCLQGRPTYVFICRRTYEGRSLTSVPNLCEYLRTVVQEMATTEKVASCNISETESHDGVLPTTQTNVHAGVLPTTQAYVHAGATPTTQTNVHAGVTPITQTHVHAGVTPTTQTNVHAGVLPTTQTNVHAGVTPITQTHVHAGATPTTQTNVHAGVTPTTQTNVHAGVDDTPIPLIYPYVEPPHFQRLPVDVSEPVYVNRLLRHAGMMSANVTESPPKMENKSEHRQQFHLVPPVVMQAAGPDIELQRDLLYNRLLAYSEAGIQPNFVPAVPVQQQPTSGFDTLAHLQSRVRAPFQRRRRFVPRRNIYSPYAVNRAHRNITSMSHVNDPRILRFQQPIHMVRNVYDPTTLPAQSQPHITARAPPTMDVEVNPSTDEVTVTILEDDE